MPVYASIDAGSNAIRMLVAAMDEDGVFHFHRLQYERTTTRLAEDLARTGNLSRRSMERTIDALKKYRRILEGYEVSGIRAVGTSAVREAANAGEFTRRVFRETGIKLEAIAHEEEARLSAKGVTGFLSSPEKNPRSFILDIGGGSTEWMITEGQTLLRSGSIPAGVVKFAGVLAGSGEAALSKMVSDTAIKLKKAVWPLPGGTGFVITGGTASTAASIDLRLEKYEHEKVHGHGMSIGRLTGIYRLLASLPLEERRRLPGLEPERADLIIPGIGLIIEIMRGFGLNRVIASDTGLPEGLILDLLERKRGQWG